MSRANFLVETFIDAAQSNPVAYQTVLELEVATDHMQFGFKYACPGIQTLRAAKFFELFDICNIAFGKEMTRTHPPSKGPGRGPGIHTTFHR